MNISQGHQEKSCLGRLLVNRGYLTESQLEQGLALQRETGQRLGEVLVQAGWVSEKERDRVLKHQSRYRGAAALVAVVALPFQPLLSFASTSAPTTERSSDASQLYEREGQVGLTPMTDGDMAKISAQGSDAFLDRIAVVDRMAMDARNSQARGELLEDADVLEGLKLVADTFSPVLGFLESDVTVSGVHYSKSKLRFELLENGGLKFALPDRIEAIRMDNIRVQAGQGAPMGNISFHDIRFHPDSSMTISTR
ncbi:pilus assembly protein PilB [Marinobacter caseinilyticus]|uniref:pilus assembly protein PilB n=1 Tax=Marinobacter caseinilyticus TaxID=2692195 RepID=UPI00140A3B49|nr:pilus assembly protein PilB [Marinobacter caseinilyticus]